MLVRIIEQSSSITPCLMDEPFGSWLQAALQFSLFATSDTLYIDADEPVSTSVNDAEVGDPRFRKLIEAVVFSRRFVLTYNVVLASILLLFTILHWGGKLTRAGRRRRLAIRARKQHVEADVSWEGNHKGGSRALETGDGSCSESSSTLAGSATPPTAAKDDVVDERKPLLPRNARLRTRTHQIPHRIRGWLMYQPRPIPLGNRILPSNGVTLLLLAFLGLNAFYVFYRTPLAINMLFAFADRTALVFVANLPLLYLLAAKNQPIKQLTGYSYEALNIVHRRLGEWLCLLALLHSAGMTGVWYTILRPTGLDLAHFLMKKIILLGLGAFIAYEALYFTSLGSFRQRWYELFLVLHIFLQLAALILVWFHHRGSRIYVGIALGIFILDRLLFRLALKTRHFRASLSILEDGKTVHVSANWQITPQRSWWRRLLSINTKQGWRPTDHVFLTVPSLSGKHFVQAHPFTIASAAPSPPLDGSPDPPLGSHAWLNLLIRAHSGFSNDLLAYARCHSSAFIRLDGPYGSPRALCLLQNADLAIVVAGGSGIAVAFPLVWALLNDVRRDAGVEEAVPRTGAKRVCLLWVVHSREQTSWLPEERIEELRARGLDVSIPRPTGEVGRPDVGRSVRRWVEGYAGDNRASKMRTGVVVSGPDGLNRDVRNVCAELVKEGGDVGVEVEKFGW